MSKGKLVFVSLSLSFLLIPAMNSFGNSTGILIPLYIYPENDSWKPLIDVRKTHPDLPIFAIINPDNGPGSFFDDQYGKNVLKLDEHRITMLGYVATNWAGKPIDDVKNEIDVWMLLYPSINGIFFDEMSAVIGNESYYSELSNYAYSKYGLDFTVGNPGTEIGTSYIGTVDNIVIHENNFLPELESIASRYSEFDKGNFSILVYDQEMIDPDFIRNLSNHVSLMYITQDKIEIPSNDHDPWEEISIHMDTMAKILDVPSFSINVFSKNLFAEEILSFNNNITIKFNDVLVRTGPTPLFFTGIEGNTYELSLSDFSNSTFKFWDNGLIDKTRLVTLLEDNRLLAIYDNDTDTEIIPNSKTNIFFYSSSCFLINSFETIESQLCDVRGITNTNGDSRVVFEGYVESKNKSGMTLSSKKNDFPFVCVWKHDSGIVQRTTDWKQVIFPDGHVVMMCKFTN